MDLKLLSWNVKHFTGPRADWFRMQRDAKEAAKQARVARVVAELRRIDPDIFGIIEVEGDSAPYILADAMPGHAFLLTEGPQTQEILVGYRRDLRVFATQKAEFKENNLFLRPAPLLDLRTDSGRVLSILFTHFKSFDTPGGWGLRTSMIGKLRDLKRALDGYALAAGEPSAAFVAMGDYNTMGMEVSFHDPDISAAQEIARTDAYLGARNLFRPEKSHPTTYYGGAGTSLPQSDLDHVYLDRSLVIAPEDGHPVRVGGWADMQAGPDRDRWVAEFSDHAPIWLTLTGL